MEVERRFASGSSVVVDLLGETCEIAWADGARTVCAAGRSARARSPQASAEAPSPTTARTASAFKADDDDAALPAAGQSGMRVGNRTFLLDGKPIRLFAGSLQHFRMHPDHWEHRLKLAKRKHQPALACMSKQSSQPVVCGQTWASTRCRRSYPGS